MSELLSDQERSVDTTDERAPADDRDEAGNPFPRPRPGKNYRPFNALRSRELYETQRARQSFDNPS